MQQEDENYVVFIGDSITEKWPAFDPDFWSGKPYVNKGIGGQVTTQMLKRFQADVIDLNPSLVVIHAGTNDIAQNKGPISIDEIAKNIFSMAELAKSNGISVVLASVLPAISYGWRKGIEPAEKIISLNNLIAQYAKENQCIYLNYYDEMVNEHKGLISSYGIDTVHPNEEGYKVMGPIAQKVITNT